MTLRAPLSSSRFPIADVYDSDTPLTFGAWVATALFSLMAGLILAAGVGVAVVAMLGGW